MFWFWCLGFTPAVCPVARRTGMLWAAPMRYLAFVLAIILIAVEYRAIKRKQARQIAEDTRPGALNEKAADKPWKEHRRAGGHILAVFRIWGRLYASNFHGGWC